MKLKVKIGLCSTFIGSLIIGFLITTPLLAAEPTTKAEFEQIDEGFRLFTEETFEGNGRSCGTCHIPEANYTIAPTDIRRANRKEKRLIFATMTPGLENFTLVKKLALFNIGPDDATVKDPHGPFRGSMTVGAFDLTVLDNFPQGPAAPAIIPAIETGWSGNGSPSGGFHHGNNDPDADGSIRAFANGAIAQHNPITLARISKETACPGKGGPNDKCDKPYDFRFATGDELDAMEVFQRWLGRRAEPTTSQFSKEIPLATMTFTDTRIEEGKAIYMNPNSSCNVCHTNGGAHFNLDILVAGGVIPGIPPFVQGANILQNTGVDEVRILLSQLTGVNIPEDEDAQGPNRDLFNLQPVIEGARKEIFFHNSAVSALTERAANPHKRKWIPIATIEDATRFYFRPPFARELDDDGNPIIGTGAENREALQPIAPGRPDTEEGFKAIFGDDGFEKLGAFQRTLSAYYSIRECERFINESIKRIEVGASPKLSSEHCLFSLRTLRKLLIGAQLDKPLHKKVIIQAYKLDYLIRLATYKKNKRLLGKILDRLENMRDSIATVAPATTVASTN